MYEIGNFIQIAIVYRANLYLIWPNHKCTIVIQSHAKTNEDKDYVIPLKTVFFQHNYLEISLIIPLKRIELNSS